jgi:uncharacterized protein
MSYHLPTAYLSPKLALRYIAEHDYHGLFAVTPVAQDEILVVWSGVLYSFSALQKLSKLQQQRTVQVEDDLFLVSVVNDEPADYVNHSCNPNAGLSGQITVVAMRDIQVGEQICIDYAMTDTTPYDEFECQCGAPNCRHRVTGDDWQLPELQERYKGYFSTYIQRKIERIKVPG